MLRVYASFFRPAFVDVDPYQIGVGNDDGLRSGAFWFYYRLGFRPVGGTERALALDEWRKIRARRSYRTPIHVLRRLAASPLRLVLRRGERGHAAPELGAIARGVTATIGERWSGDHSHAAREAWHQLQGWMSPRPCEGWSRAEIAAARRLSTLAVSLPGVSGWGRRDREALLELLRAKGGRTERDYVERLRAHRQLREALAQLAENDGAPGEDAAR